VINVRRRRISPERRKILAHNVTIVYDDAGNFHPRVRFEPRACAASSDLQLGGHSSAQQKPPEHNGLLETFSVKDSLFRCRSHHARDAAR
jgi:hypothetical protein